MKKKIALAISAHADDAHIALGGTIKRLLEEGEYQVHYVGFSIAEDSVPKGFPKDVVAKECIAGLKILGLDKKYIQLFKYPVRTFPARRQEILDELIKIRDKLKPELVFIPSTEDIHQDHIVICEEGIRAFRRTSSLFGYDFPWNVLYGERLNLFYEISKDHLDIKIKSLKAYKSQIAKNNNCLTPDYIRSLAIERGNRIGVPFAEAFETIREVKTL